MTFSSLFATAVMVLALALPVRAAPYSAIYAFGDSLSDVGNAFVASRGTIPPSPPYANGQFSNGPVWIQGLAGALGLPALTPSLLGGTNYAYGGAHSGASVVHAANATDVTGPTGQLAQYFATHPTSDPAALYTFWIGSNDMLSILASGRTFGQIIQPIVETGGNITSAITALAASGAKNILFVDVPDLGRTPAVRALGPAAQSAATTITNGLGNLLSSGGDGVPSLRALEQQLGINLSFLDSYALLTAASGAPDMFGFTNATDPCLTSAGVCAPTVAEQNRFLYWDDLHPTAAGHAVIAAAALAVLEVPEPGTLLLVGAGLAMVAVRRRPQAGVTTNRR